MNRLSFFRGARGAAAAIVFVAVVAFVVFVRPGLDRLAADDARLAEATQALDADRVALTRLRAFPVLRRKYRAEIGSVDVRSSDAVLVADFLATAVRDAARRDVVVVSLSSDPHVAPTSQKATFRDIPLVLTQEGRYADVLATLDAFSHAHEIVRVDGIDITRVGDGRAPRRDVHVVVALRILRLERDPGRRGDPVHHDA